MCLALCDCPADCEATPVSDLPAGAVVTAATGDTGRFDSYGCDVAAATSSREIVLGYTARRTGTAHIATTSAAGYRHVIVLRASGPTCRIHDCVAHGPLGAVALSQTAGEAFCIVIDSGDSFGYFAETRVQEVSVGSGCGLLLSTDWDGGAWPDGWFGSSADAATLAVMAPSDLGAQLRFGGATGTTTFQSPPLRAESCEDVDVSIQVRGDLAGAAPTPSTATLFLESKVGDSTWGPLWSTPTGSFAVEPVETVVPKSQTSPYPAIRLRVANECPAGTCDDPSGWFTVDDVRVEGTASHACKPSCEGKACGPDGCFGSCGGCAAGLACSDAGQCAEPPSGCDGAVDLTGPSTVAGTSAGAPNAVFLPPGVHADVPAGGGRLASDRIYRFVAPETRIYTAALTAQPGALLVVSSSCTGALDGVIAAAEVEPWAAQQETRARTVFLTKGTSVYLVVDGARARTGGFTYTVGIQ